MIPAHATLFRHTALVLAIGASILVNEAGAQGRSAPKPQAATRQRLSNTLTEANIESAPTRFPLRISARGPVTLQLQILLDRAGFSPGIIDGAWGINAGKAITFFTKPDDTERLNGDSPP